MIEAEAPWWFQFLWQAPIAAGWVVWWFERQDHKETRAKLDRTQEKAVDGLLQSATAMTLLSAKFESSGRGGSE